VKSIVVRRIVIAGVMSAIAIFLGATRLGFIPWFAGASLTIMHVPVIIAAVLAGPMAGIAVGLLFGVASLIQAAVAPNGPADAWFVNPLVSVIPRIFIGPVAWLLDRAGTKAGRMVGLVAAGIGGSLTNTLLVLGVLGLYAYIPWALVGTIAVTNGLLEAAAAAILTVAVVAAWQGLEYGRRGSRLE
jgi:uncharacterized membrane protein